MNTVIKGTKTIAEYKRVREDMENLARANYARHKEAFEEWGEGEPVKAWFDFKMSLKKWKILEKYCAYSKKYITYILTIHYISYIIYIQ
jgi:hypothetical protein